MFTYPYYGTWPSKTPVHLLEFELCEYKDHIFWIGHDPNDHSKKRIYVISPSGSDLGDELIEPDTITKIKITPHLFGLLKTTTSITEKDISEGWEKRKVKSIILKLTRMFDRWEIEEKERDIECIKNRESYEKIAAAIVDGKEIMIPAYYISDENKKAIKEHLAPKFTPDEIAKMEAMAKQIEPDLAIVDGKEP